MTNKIKFGVLKETKNPPDRRVAVTPRIAKKITEQFPNVDLFIQKSDYRAIGNEEYEKLGLNLVDDVSHCDILIGVKEVAKPELIANKSYIYFSHTAKKQPYNRELLQKNIELGLTLMDHEYFTEENGARVVAFGRWAGIVGAFNGLIAYGKKFGLYNLKRAKECHDYKEMLEEVKKAKLPAIKILITGGGRVAHGALETLAPLNLKKVSADDFVNKTFDEPVVCQIDPDNYVERKDGKAFDLSDFFKNPSEYKSTFLRYTKVTDFFIPCHFWDQNSPVFMTPDDMKADDFKMKVIADVSCDIKDPIPSTLRASTIADPFFGYDPNTEQEVGAFAENAVTVMSVDNLPGELPRDASEDFGDALLNNVFPSLFGDDSRGIVNRATIVKDGKLTEKYKYLQNFADGKE
jgi:Alanine dehydrogenase/PNT, N-terminal domain